MVTPRRQSGARPGKLGWIERSWKNYSLSIVLAALFLTSWTLQTWTGWRRFAAQQIEHGQEAHVFGSGGYIWEWASATMENWQSEFLQLLTFVVLTAYLIHRGSHESRDSDDEMKAILLRVDARVARLEHRLAEHSPAERDQESSHRRSER